jgi:hypothetical protein
LQTSIALWTSKFMNHGNAKTTDEETGTQKENNF